MSGPAAELVGTVGARVREAKRIAVLRANGIGDFIFAIPALHALRAAYPSATIVLLGAPWHAETLAPRAVPLDRVEVVPPLPGIRAPLPSEGSRPWPEAQTERFFERMSAERFDLAVQLHGGGLHSNPFVRRLGARVTAGLATPEAVALDRSLPFYHFQPEVVRFLDVVALVGVAPVTLTPRWPVTDADRREARAALPAAAGPLAAIAPAAGARRRRWPAEKFAHVADALAEAGARVAVVGSGDDAALTRAVIARMARPGALDLAGGLSLGGLGGLLERTRLLVGNDSGPLHLARAVGTATVGVYWCGNLINAGPMTNARHRVALSWRLECPECGANCMAEGCEHDASFLGDVDVAEVMEPALDLWSREAVRPLGVT